MLACAFSKYEVFEKLIEKQLSFFWRPEEIDVSAASGYENFIKGAVYVVADFTVGKFRVAEDLDVFGRLFL